jgi:predicted lipoprotein
MVSDLRHAMRAVVALAIAVAPAGCVVVSTNRTPGPEPDTGAGRDGGGDRPDAPVATMDASAMHRAEQVRMVLASVATRVILPRLRAFDEAALELERATGVYAESLADSDRASAQRAWRDAMAIWEELEVLQVGPAGPMPRPGVEGTYGGRGLRDPIYSWPERNPCRVDQETVSRDYEDIDTFAATELVNVRGLDAIEYLLFVAGEGNACAASATINASGQWAALGADEIRRRRARYAHALAILVRRHARELRAAWEPPSADVPGGENFAAQFAGAGTAGSVYPSAQEGLNALSHAMFYLEYETKDRKLAAWIGMGDMCMDPACPLLLESRFAGANREHLIANLRGFRAAFLGADPGTEAPGFDDLLVWAGASDLRDRMIAAIDAAHAAFESLPPITPATLAANTDAVNDARLALKGLTDLLKTEFLTVLDLELPMGRDGDND